jgi:MinD-like ATPase involved in chromosome partitioning or flagellar assembly
MIYTFYSYKGGVGRSMALANVAELLHRRGLDVLMVDFDLEAPGLERYFSEAPFSNRAEEVAARRGLIDLLNSYKELRSLPGARTPPPADGPEDDHFPYPVEPLSNFVVTVYEKGPGTGSLSLIPAGRRAGKEFTSYAQQVRGFDWADFHERWDGERFFNWFRREAEKLADVVLVDSRTGVTEMGGVCVYQLADVVVMFVATNHQNVGGTAAMARSLVNPKLIEGARKGRPLAALFVPSRVENYEKELLDRFAHRFNDTFTPLTAYEGGGDLFNELKVPYVPYFSFMEKVAAREAGSASAHDLNRAFESIIEAVARIEPEGGPLRRLHDPAGQGVQRPRRVFVSYARAEPDAGLAARIVEALEPYHHVFNDQKMLIGENWVERMESEMRGADFFVALLSQAAVSSETMTTEIARAFRFSREQGGRPLILPVRLAYDGPLPYPLSAYLDSINYAVWNRNEDTDGLISQLLGVLAGAELPGAQSRREPPPAGALPTHPAGLESPGGVVSPRSAFYLERNVDRVALEAIAPEGVTINIRGPRQVGKSSLLMKTLEAAAAMGKRIALIDFQLFDRAALTDGSIFFRQFCSLLTDELALEDRVEEFWNKPMGMPHLCTRYVERYVLREIGGPLVLAMEEFDSIMTADFFGDFVAMLRSWHESRADVRSGVWMRLDLVLVMSTEPYMFKDQPNSPFNVGWFIEPTDFTAEQVAELNRRHNHPLSPAEVRQLVELTGGHPYLVRLALYLVASEKSSFAELLTNAADERGPFGDHLRSYLLKLHAKPELVAALREVIVSGRCPDEDAFFRLRGAGLVTRSGTMVSARCRLYEEFFRRHFDV